MHLLQQRIELGSYPFPSWFIIASMGFIDVMVLALTQAITEFVPVSSSGHLIAVQEVFGLESSIGLDVMLHFGTLVALIVYFWRDLMTMAKNLLSGGNNKLLISIVISTVPAVVVGLAFEDIFTDDARNIGVVTFMLFIVGLLMIAADKLFAQSKMHTDEMTKTEALFIGIAQSLALVPGTSRSGITMLAARSQGLSNEDSARYSFLIGIPIIFGATLRVVFNDETNAYIKDNLWQTLLGVAVAAISGWFVLKVLIPFVAKHGLTVFGWYRLALASVLFIIWINT